MLGRFRLPLRFLRGSGWRLAATVVALACGVALVCALDLVNRAVLRAFTQVIDAMAGRAALQVTSGNNGLFAESLSERIGEVPGVELAVAIVSASAFTTDGAGETLNVHGVDLANDAAVRVYEARDESGLEIEDPLVFLNQPDSIVLTRAFAARRGLSLESRLPLDTPAGRVTFTVRGLLEPHGVARVYEGNLIVMDLQAAEAAFTAPGLVNRIDVVVREGADVDAVARAIGATLPDGLRVDTPAQRKADLDRVMQSLGAMLQAMSVVGLIAAFLIAYSRLGAVFEARAWQLGVMRAGGVRTKQIWGALVRESLLLGAAGVVLGVPLGIGVARVILPLIAATAALNYKLVAPDAQLTLSPSSIVLAVGLGCGAALLAAALPAWRAARSTVIETIRHRGIEDGSQGSRLGWGARAAVGLAIVAAVALQSFTRSPAWGLIATGLIAVATALAAQPIVKIAQATVLPGLAWAAGPAARFTTRVLGQKTRRTALTVAMLGVGLGSIVWLRIVGHSFEQSLTEALSAALQGDLVVTSSHVASGYLEAPIHEGLRDEVRAVAGVRATVAERLVDWRLGDGPIAIDAFDAAYFSSTDFGRWPLIGASEPRVWELLAHGQAVLVSSNFAINIGVAVGDPVVLETPQGRLETVVAGMTVNFSSPRGTIVMSRDLYRRYWRDAQVNRVFLRTDATVPVASVRSVIERGLGRKYGLRVISATGLIDYFQGEVRRAFAPVDILGGLVLLVVLVGVADTLSADIVDRTREVGVIRALGVRRRYLRRMVLCEALVLGGLGLVLALSAGLVLGTLWVKQTFTHLLGWALELHVPWWALSTAVVTTVAICCVAAIVPARRVSALEPARALRYE